MKLDRKSVEVLAADYEHDVKHSRQVARLAEELFDKCELFRSCGEREKELLVAAALLHDIGWCGGQSKHHKRSFELIMSNPPEGLSLTETVIVANVARYHRKALPALSHEKFAALEPQDRETVRHLAAVLRIADGLDVTHVNAVSIQSVEVSPREVLITVSAETSGSFETDAAKEKSDLFEEVYGRKVKFKIV